MLFVITHNTTELCVLSIDEISFATLRLYLKIFEQLVVGLGVRVFRSGSDQFLSSPGLSGLEHLDPIGI